MENNKLLDETVRQFKFLSGYDVSKGGQLLEDNTFVIENKFQPPRLCDVDNRTHNSYRLHSINEISVKRFLGLHLKKGFVVISACKSNWDTNDLKNREINNQKSNELERKINSKGYSYIPVFGGFKEKINQIELTDNEIETYKVIKGEEIEISSNLFVGYIKDKPYKYNKIDVYERSFIVFNYNTKGDALDFQELYSSALEWTVAYDQDSVLIKKPNGNPQYITQNNEVDKEFTGDNDMSQDYFTDFIKSRKIKDNSRDHRFTFEDICIKPKPASLNERHVRYLKGERIFGI